ncbi:MAG: hypothetical protein R3B06_10700 [Kofleriaceae bacterium]
MDDAEDPVAQWLEVARGLLGEGDDQRTLTRANQAVDQALALALDHAPAWLVKCQILSAKGDDLAALAAAEAALRHAPGSAEAHYWRGALLGDLGHVTEGLVAIECALEVIGAAESWLLEDLYFEKASLFQALGRTDEARAALVAGLARCPSSTLLRSGLEPTRPPRSPALTLLRGGLT